MLMLVEDPEGRIQGRASGGWFGGVSLVNKALLWKDAVGEVAKGALKLGIVDLVEEEAGVTHLKGREAERCWQPKRW